jgi:hypothetical protein
MADQKISQLTASTTPLAGTEVLPIVQSGTTKQVSVANLTAGRVVDASRVRTTGDVYVGANAAAFAERLRVFGNYMVLDNGTYTGFIGGGSSIGVGGATDLSFRSQGGMAFGINGTTSALAISTAANVTVSAGNLVIGTAGKGIDFSADPSAAGMTSELLDDYEEGTWTVTYSTSGGNFSSITYAYQTGKYVKIGSYVFAYGQIGTTVTPTGGSGTVRISLPFTANNAGIPPGGGKVAFNSSWTTSYPTHFVALGNSAQANLVTTAASGQISDLGVANLGLGNFMEFSVFYQTTA